MPPKAVVDLNDTDDGLCNTKHLVSTSATTSSPQHKFDGTYGGRQDCMVVPSWNVERDTSTMKSQSDSNESESQGKPFGYK